MAQRPPPTTPTLGPSLDDAAQATALRRARRRATGLLVVVGAGFLASFALPETTATGYLRAALEAGLVGGLADWFAVVALFRHPLGIPIPHTAVIPRSKDGLGANIATFVRGNFLGADQLRGRLVDPAHPRRLGEWLAQPANADRVAVWVAGAAASVLDVLDEGRVVDRVVVAVRHRLRELPVAELTGQALEDVILAQRHAPVVSATIDGLLDVMARNRPALRRRLGEQSPAWVPPAIDDLVFDRAEDVVRTFLRQLAADPAHELRHALDEQLLTWTQRLRTDPEVAAKVDDAVDGVLTDELLARWVSTWWRELRDQLAVAADPAETEARLRKLTTEALVDLGRRLQTDRQLQGRIVAALEEFAPRVASHAEHEAGQLITTTIDRWDADDTARRLELWMGRDLQFVRINGTVVGALVGIALHAVTQGLGG